MIDILFFYASIHNYKAQMADDLPDEDWDDGANEGKRKRGSQAAPGDDLEFEPESKRIKTAETESADQVEYVLLDDTEVAEWVGQARGPPANQVQSEVTRAITQDQLMDVFKKLLQRFAVEIGPRVHNYWIDTRNFDTLRRRIMKSQHHANNTLYTIIFEPGMNRYRALKVDLQNRIEQFRSEVNQAKAVVGWEGGMARIRQILPPELAERARGWIEDSESAMVRWRDELQQPFSFTSPFHYTTCRASLRRLRNGADLIIIGAEELINAIRSMSKERFRADITASAFVAGVRARQLMLKVRSLRQEIELTQRGFDSASVYMEMQAPIILPAHVYQRDGHRISEEILFYGELLNECVETIRDLPGIGNLDEVRVKRFAIDHILWVANEQMSEEEIAAFRRTSYPDTYSMKMVHMPITYANQVTMNYPKRNPLEEWMETLEKAQPFFDKLVKDVDSLLAEVRDTWRRLSTTQPTNSLAPELNANYDVYKNLKLFYVTMRDGLSRLPNHPVNRYITPRKLASLEMKLTSATEAQKGSIFHFMRFAKNMGDSIAEWQGFPSASELARERLQAPYVAHSYSSREFYIRDEAMSGDDDDGEDSVSDNEYEITLDDEAPDVYL
jgi:hypothetical protein